MRTRVLLMVLIAGLLTACADTVPTPTPLDLPATPSPVIVNNAPPTAASDPGAPPPESTSSVPPTLLALATPPQPAGAPATPPPIPAGPLTIVALGDSLTEGDGDQPGEGGGFPARLSKAIKEVRPNSQIINLGKSGWDSAQLIEGQLPDALAAHPHLALVWIGSNDLWNNSGPGQEAADLARYTNNLDQTLRALTESGTRVFIALLDDQSQRPYATDPASAGMSPEGVADMSRLVSAFNAAIAARATAYGATTVDFYHTTIFTDPATLAEDGLHPNAKGYDLIAQIWFAAIRPTLP